MIFLLSLWSASLAEGLAAVRSGEYEKAQKEFAAFISEHPADAGAAQATLWLARLESNPTEAREIYLRVVANHSATPYADSALLEAASIDYAFGLYQQAATKLKQLLSLYPKSQLYAETNYWLGVCYRILSDQAAAAVYFKQAEQRGAGTIWGTLAAGELSSSGVDTSAAPPVVIGGGYAVQVGSFTERERAESLLSEYKSGGRSGEIQEAQVSGKTYYRVRLGPFPTNAEASTYAEVLKAQGKAAMVVKR